MSPEDPELAGKLAHAEEVAKILKENIVQGKLQEDNKYSELFLSILDLLCGVVLWDVYVWWRKEGKCCTCRVSVSGVVTREGRSEMLLLLWLWVLEL